MGGYGSGRPGGSISDDYAMSFAEIGAALGCSEEEARGMFRRALQKIRRSPITVQQFAGLVQAARETRKQMVPGLKNRLRQGGIRAPA